MIPLLSPEEAQKRGAESGVPSPLTTVNAFRVLLNNPAVAGPAGRMLAALLFGGSLDARLRELIILRNGWLSGSEYEFCQHVAVARRLKIPEQDILGVRDPANCKSFNELDRAVIKMTDDLMKGTDIGAEVWSILTRTFQAPQLIELVMVAGYWRLFAAFLKAAQVPLDEGVASWPEGVKPPAALG
ncbi:MAG TPA: carboxymuconolactone decarboxylase family protein [Candidatus Binataceae bacterium]|nr:carboxymuconolactone decarboxylase family protein [Candidatus Binataceae bacterium]